MALAAGISVSGGEGMEWMRLTDSFDRKLVEAHARETLRQLLDLERAKARIWIGEYAAAVKRGSGGRRG